MSLRYRCLLVDHDDTAVDSTADIHYPAHLEALRILRPERPPPSLERWLLVNFHPGISEYLSGDLGLDEREIAVAVEVWRQWTGSRTPRFFPGFLSVLADYRAAGGRVAVISHSERDVIEKHYQAAREPSFLPDAIYGWDDDPHRRKPSPWPVRDALDVLGCAPEEAVILDDLKPGALMAEASGVAFVAAGWSHRVPEIEAYMRKHCDAYLTGVEELRELLFDG
jgi:beta-phosphoglucomutase-like phosphatase (HAD superfamily)